MSADSSDSAAASSRFGVGIARAFAGALIFALPMLMTMELWHLGFYMDRYRLVLLMIVAFPMLVGLSYYGGFEETPRLRDEIGRASCRERVCQYVSISVGAVSLQTTTTSKK